MEPKTIKITLKSAATFGRGDGVAGLVDREIEHDASGFPFLRGKTLKGLLAESAENLVFALTGDHNDSVWYKAKERLFGKPGRGTTERGILHIGDAELPVSLRAAVKNDKWEPADVLYSLTSIRRQTAVNEQGAPVEGSLRTMRVLLPGVTLEAPLSFEDVPGPQELQLLAAAVLDFRRAGTGRNRGRGWLKAELDNDEATQKLFEKFVEAVQ
jgi:CRISPR/Cas system CSM-associated protein Csm3 (group 7 of RAMP superfamily)